MFISQYVFICFYHLDWITEKYGPVYENDEKMRIELWDQNILDSCHVPIVAKSLTKSGVYIIIFYWLLFTSRVAFNINKIVQ